MALYSPTKDAVFCHFCIFSSAKNKETTFTNIGYRDWKKANQKFEKHEKSQCHIDATVDFTIFVLTLPSMNKFLMKQQGWRQQDRRRLERTDREIMKRLVDITLNNCSAKHSACYIDKSFHTLRYCFQRSSRRVFKHGGRVNKLRKCSCFGQPSLKE